MAYLKVYTRSIVEARTYPSALAHSVHFAVSIDGVAFEQLNYNYGILYPRAEISAENTILERGAMNPKIIRVNGEIFIFADFVDVNGIILCADMVYLWKTHDLVGFKEIGLVLKSDLPFTPTDASDVITVTLPELGNLLQSFSKLSFSHIRLPEKIEINDIDELHNVCAEVVYSDGSVDVKPVKWDVSGVTDSGEYAVHGEVQQREYPYPSAEGFADPVIFKWQGRWYFIATNDNTGDVGMYVRGADTVEELFASENEPVCILPYDEDRGFIQTFWAPEFHVIGGELYILFAVGGRIWSPQSHMMKLKRGGDILRPEDWEEPIRVKRADGNNLTDTGITLDMTYFRFDARSYLCWSQRWFGPDTGSMLYIAEIDEREPYRLISEPVLLSRPLYGWENQSGTINNEGPYPLLCNDKLYLSYSGGAAGGYSYVVGYLIAEHGADLLDPASWRKTSCPVSSSVMFSDREGPAHCSFFVDDDGKTYFACHAQRPGQDQRRNTSITRVHFDRNGYPVLGFELSDDLPEDKKEVRIRVIFGGKAEIDKRK